MEELFFFLIQFLIEVLVNVLAFESLDFIFIGRDRDSSSLSSLLYLLLIAVSALLGGLSIYLIPHLLIHYPVLRVVNLIISPLVAAGVAWRITKWRRSKLCPWTSAWCALLAVLAFASVRLTLAAQ